MEEVGICGRVEVAGAVICMGHCAAQVWVLFFLAWALLAIYFHSGWLWRAVNSLCSEETQRRFCAMAAPYSSCNACKTNLIGRLCHFDVGPECEWP